MKKTPILIIAGLLLAITALSSPSGSKKGEVIPFPLTKIKNTQGSRPHAPAYPLFLSSVDTEASLLIISSNYDVNKVTATLDNVMSGEHYDYIFDSAETALLPFSCTSGIWQICLILNNGSEYEGEFQLF